MVGYCTIWEITDALTVQYAVKIEYIFQILNTENIPKLTKLKNTSLDI